MGANRSVCSALFFPLLCLFANLRRPQENTMSPSAPPSEGLKEPPLSTVPSQPELLPEAESQQTAWEEPTTIQPPTWDDEPQAAISVSSSVATGGWSASVTEESKLQRSQDQTVPPAFEPVEEPPKPVPETVAEDPAPQKPIAPRPKIGTGVRYKSVDQPVVMPSAAFGSSLEKVGMQFGSLSLGGESLFEPR
jgi:hypothetical protein